MTKYKRKIYKRDKYGIIKKSTFDLFLDEYAKNDGNATKAIQKIVGTKNYASATRLASYYLSKAREMGVFRTFLEKKGYGGGKLIDVAIQKMEESKTPEWWDRLMKISGYEDFLNTNQKSTIAVNILQTQEKLRKEYGFSDVIEGEIEENEGL